jgi:hypothetical protein
MYQFSNPAKNDLSSIGQVVGYDELNSPGQVAGYSDRYTSTGASEGQDSWFFNGTRTQQIGLTGAGYSYHSSGGTYQASSPWVIDDAGQVVGYSERYTSTGAVEGQDSWFFNGTGTQQIGLTGAGYSYASNGGTYQSSSPSLNAPQINSAGQVIGYSTRYNPTGTSEGQDSWLFSGTSTQQIGLTGAGYSYASSGGTVQQSYPDAINSAGQVIGSSNRYTSSGTSEGSGAWLFNGTSTQQLGLTGASYSYSLAGGTFEASGPNSINSAGQVNGVSNRYTSTGTSEGRDSWFFNGTSIRQIGLTGTGYSYSSSAGTYQYSVPRWMNEAGQIFGYSNRYTSSGTSEGQDTWFFNGTNAQQIGLTGAGYSYSSSVGTYQSSTPWMMNSNGQVAGTSNRYTSSGTPEGQDCWFFNGTSTEEIEPPTGAGFSYSINGNTYEGGQPSEINSAGQVVGVSDLYTLDGTVEGQGAWFFDPATDKTYPLVFSFGTDGYTFPEYLTSTGVVLGVYERLAGTVDETPIAFSWSEANGFSNLGSLVNGGLSSQGWQELSAAYDSSGTAPDGSPFYIDGYGLLAGQSGGQSAYLLSDSVPEPAAGAFLLGIASILGLRRRRQS